MRRSRKSTTRASAQDAQRTQARPAGQARRRRGLLHRLLSFFGALLTLLTALAVLALLLGPLPRSLSEVPADGSAAKANAAGGWLQVARTLAQPEFRWVRSLLAAAMPEGLNLADRTFTLAGLPSGKNLTFVVDRLNVAPEAAGARARLTGRLDDRSNLRVQGSARLTDGELHAELRLASIEGLQEVLELADTDLAGGPILVEMTAALAGGPIDLVVRSAGQLAVRGPGMPQPLPVDALEATLAWEPGTDTLNVEQASLASPALNVTAHGRVGRDQLAIAATFTDVDASWAPRLWPPNVASGAHDWVTENITAGLIERLDLQLQLDEAALAGPLPLDAIQGEAQISGAEVHYLRPMPPVTGASATAQFDADTLTFTITGGDLQDVEVTGGEVRITDISRSDTVEMLSTRIEASGGVPTILDVVDSEPLTLATRYGLPKDQSAGRGRFTIEVALPLRRDVALEEVDLLFTGDFQRVTLPGVAAGRDLDAAELTLEATPDRVEARGSGLIADVPLAFTFLVDALSDRETIGVSGRVDAASLERLGLPTGLPIDGTVGLNGELSIGDDVTSTDLTLDLTDAEVSVPILAVWKPQGIQGEARAQLTERPDSIELERVAFAWPGVEIAAAGSLTPSGDVETLVVDPLIVAGTQLAVTIQGVDTGLTVSVTGPRLDLDPLHQPPREVGDEDTTLDRNIDISLAIGEVSSGSPAALLDTTGSARIEGGRLRALTLDARTTEATEGLRVRVAPDAVGGVSLNVASNDAGGALRALGLSDALFGGVMQANAVVAAPGSVAPTRGTISVENAAVVGAPPLVVRLAAAPAIEGLATGAIQVTSFESAFTLEGTELDLEDAYIRAAELAVRVSGTVDLRTNQLDLQGSLAPLATINQFIGNIPLIGNLLQGQREPGAFAIAFSITGPRDDPRVSVNPLTVVTPGALQDMFGGAIVPDNRSRTGLHDE